MANQRHSDIGLYKAEVLKKVVENKFPNVNMDTMLDSETFKNPSSDAYLWETFDVIISTVDEYHIINSLLQKAIESNVPIIIIDAPGMTITTHSMIPYIDTEKDIQKYRQLLQQKQDQENYNLNSVILTFPASVNHCILWAKSIFTMFFTTFYYKLSDFHRNPQKIIGEYESQLGSLSSYDLHIIELIKFLYLQKTKREFGNCVDLSIDFFMVAFLHL